MSGPQLSPLRRSDSMRLETIEPFLQVVNLALELIDIVA
jgi:hypothetical protein